MTDTTTIPDSAEPLVLEKNDWRVEIHLRRDEDEIATLLAYAGREHTPERAMHQGPFQRIDQAIGARRAIVGAMLADGYRLLEEELPIWTLNAQRDINSIRERKELSSASYKFDPKDVFLDW
ncbi:hypothetical protein [Gilvimarinus algae]|uniref:Uncharacterized protein n=1 Tax=Gilvimarinus algae TaxID=3058037 RepID=A0ABT8THT0_9GAMM|nr:hypothetical protein [Gilvimarinus sp. SDUM040014]MDO3383654.1 hypothetical protein [Gilvimarinus sp. SDUM040014]